MSAFIAIVFASLLSRLGYQMARSPVLPIFAADLGALPELIGVIVAASTITGVFFKLPSGALSDVLGRKRMMVLGALFFAAPPFLYPLVHDPWSLLALRFVHGFATAIFSPVASAYVASLAETGRGARLGWFSSANDIGATGGPLVGGFVLYFTTSFTLTYLLVGALGVLTLLVVLLLPEVDPPARQTKTFTARTAEFRQGLAEASCAPLLYKRYRAVGMGRRTIDRVLRSWARLLIDFSNARTRADVAPLMVRLGRELGRLTGSIRHRVFFP